MSEPVALLYLVAEPSEVGALKLTTLGVRELKTPWVLLRVRHLGGHSTSTNPLACTQSRAS